MSTNPNHTEEVSLSRQKKNPTCIRNKREEHVKSISGRGPISGLHSGLRVQAGRGRAVSREQTDGQTESMASHNACRFPRRQDNAGLREPEG